MVWFEFFFFNLFALIYHLFRWFNMVRLRESIALNILESILKIRFLHVLVEGRAK